MIDPHEIEMLAKNIYDNATNNGVADSIRLPPLLTERDPFWKNVETHILHFILLFMFENVVKDDCSLGTAIKFAKSIEYATFDDFVKKHTKFSGESVNFVALYKMLRYTSDKVRVRATKNVRLYLEVYAISFVELFEEEYGENVVRQVINNIKIRGVDIEIVGKANIGSRYL
ncbi:MAG: hypothetical protein FWC20_00650 [Oscillospiraceae bacterium]|nr:hypothetical protein [Oscillospiraceae bacterium]MCL2277902.1 hypothetical protein [Oscillospiraceae bacterium]